MCVKRECNRRQTPRKVKEIANSLVDLQTSSGKEREQLKLRIVKKFKLNTDEKYLATRLRLMLIKFDSCRELLAIGCNGKKTFGEDLDSQQYKSLESKANLIASGASTKQKKPRQSLEEKQLAKLRALNTEDVMADEIEESKIKFLGAFGLVPATITL